MVSLLDKSLHLIHCQALGNVHDKILNPETYRVPAELFARLKVYLITEQWQDDKRIEKVDEAVLADWQKPWFHGFCDHAAMMDHLLARTCAERTGYYAIRCSTTFSLERLYNLCVYTTKQSDESEPVHRDFLIGHRRPGEPVYMQSGEYILPFHPQGVRLRPAASSPPPAASSASSWSGFYTIPKIPAHCSPDEKLEGMARVAPMLHRSPSLAAHVDHLLLTLLPPPPLPRAAADGTTSSTSSSRRRRPLVPLKRVPCPHVNVLAPIGWDESTYRSPDLSQAVVPPDVVPPGDSVYKVLMDTNNKEIAGTTSSNTGTTATGTELKNRGEKVGGGNL
ncbi:hypothetical protein Pelo_17886 [Pelomyxa schiedti]|nr:hypothetical protein Pelo_17886 [Pelomyxa schiedti]